MECNNVYNHIALQWDWAWHWCRLITYIGIEHWYWARLDYIFCGKYSYCHGTHQVDTLRGSKLEKKWWTSAMSADSRTSTTISCTKWGCRCGECNATPKWTLLHWPILIGFATVIFNRPRCSMVMGWLARVSKILVILPLWLRIFILVFYYATPRVCAQLARQYWKLQVSLEIGQWIKS